MSFVPHEGQLTRFVLSMLVPLNELARFTPQLMKLTTKLTLAFVALMAVVTLVVSLVAAQLEWSIFRAEHERIANTISNEAYDSLSDAWKKEGNVGLASEIHNLKARSEVFAIEWVWFSSRSSLGSDRPTPDVQRMTVGRIHTMVGKDPDGSRRIHAYVPIIEDGEKLGGLDVSESMAELDHRTRRIWWTSLGSITSMFVLSGLLIAWIGSRIVGRPLEKLVEKTNRAAQGEFDQPISVRGNDELAGLTMALNQMCDQLQSQRTQIESETQARIAALSQLRHADRLQTIGQLASGIAHEMGTPLNVILGHADLIGSQSMPPEEIIESTTTIKNEVVRMTGIVSQLLNLARRKTGLREQLDLVVLLRDTIELLHTVAHPQGVNLLLSTTLEIAIVFADAEQLKQVFLNILMNAIQAMPDGGNIDLSLTLFENETATSGSAEATHKQVPAEIHQPPVGTWFRVRIEDHGAGIEPTKLKKIFEPFFTTKDPGEGTGLGLSIAYGIIQEHDGWINAASEPGVGARFDIYLPVFDSSRN